ncbi:MAG: hypothetical protein JSW03_02370, partial [Candidatus Eiseniibacteriota bacterium]
DPDRRGVALDEVTRIELPTHAIGRILGRRVDREDPPVVRPHVHRPVAGDHRIRESPGVSEDGDGDGIGAVDDKGRIIWGDQLVAVFATDILARNPGGTIIFDVKCSQGLEEHIRALGGRPLMWRTGHSLIKRKLKEEKALLAGEMSGHMFFADGYYGYDDAIFAAARLVSLISRSEKPLSALIDELPRYVSTPEIRLECPDSLKFRLVERLRQFFADTREVIDIDGARILFGDGWGLVRASNTQPALVARFEARSEKRLDEIRTEVLGKVASLKSDMVGTG